MGRISHNSGYIGSDQRRTKAGSYDGRKHYLERIDNQFLYFSGWTPAEISTVFWLDAADASTITESGGTVTQWADKSGNGRNATQATAANQPTYSATNFPGNLPGLLFDGSNDIMDVSTTAMQNQTHGVYWVWSRSGAGSGDAYRPFIGVLASAGQGTDRGALHYVKTSNYGACYPYYNGPSIISYDLSSGTQYVSNTGYLMAFQSNTTGWGVWRNGTLEATTNAIATPDNTNAGYSIGGQYSVSRRTNGVISEVIMVDTTDTTTRQLIEGYLAHKWGLTANLPNDHPYKNTAP